MNAPHIPSPSPHPPTCESSRREDANSDLRTHAFDAMRMWAGRGSIDERRREPVDAALASDDRLREPADAALLRDGRAGGDARLCDTWTRRLDARVRRAVEPRQQRRPCCHSRRGLDRPAGNEASPVLSRPHLLLAHRRCRAQQPRSDEHGHAQRRSDGAQGRPRRSRHPDLPTRRPRLPDHGGPRSPRPPRRAGPGWPQFHRRRTPRRVPVGRQANGRRDLRALISSVPPPCAARPA